MPVFSFGHFEGVRVRSRGSAVSQNAILNGKWYGKIPL
jgi:hypothetical protein